MILLCVYPNFLIFKLSNVSNKDTALIRKRFLRSAISKRNKELQHVLKELSISENLLSKQLFTIEFYILKKSLTLHINESLQNRYILNRKSYLHWRGVAAYLYSQLTKLLLTSRNINYPRKNPIYLKQVYTFQSNQIQFESPKLLLPLKRFIVLLLTTLNPRKQKVRYKGISRILLTLISTTTNLFHVYYVNIASYETLEK